MYPHSFFPERNFMLCIRDNDFSPTPYFSPPPKWLGVEREESGPLKSQSILISQEVSYSLLSEKFFSSTWVWVGQFYGRSDRRACVEVHFTIDLSLLL